jgi:hypothetical protein
LTGQTDKREYGGEGFHSDLGLDARGNDRRRNFRLMNGSR